VGLAERSANGVCPTREIDGQCFRGIVQRNVSGRMPGYAFVHVVDGDPADCGDLAPGVSTTRVGLTGHSGSGRSTSSPMKSRLAAISLGCKQPKTRPKVGTKKLDRSGYKSSHFFWTNQSGWSRCLRSLVVHRRRFQPTTESATATLAGAPLV
jgi:hypothetical protein